MESSKRDWTLSGTATSLQFFFLKILFLVPKVFNSWMFRKQCFMKIILHRISIQTLLFQACLLSRQNGVENRDKAYPILLALEHAGNFPSLRFEWQVEQTHSVLCTLVLPVMQTSSRFFVHLVYLLASHFVTDDGYHNWSQQVHTYSEPRLMLSWKDWIISACIEHQHYVTWQLGSPYSWWDTTLKKQSPAPPTSNIDKPCWANLDCSNI